MRCHNNSYVAHEKARRSGELAELGVSAEARGERKLRRPSVSGMPGREISGQGAAYAEKFIPATGARKTRHVMTAAGLI